MELLVSYEQSVWRFTYLDHLTAILVLSFSRPSVRYAISSRNRRFSPLERISDTG